MMKTRGFACTLTNLVQRSDTKAGRMFDSFSLSLILYSVVSLSIETLPDLSDGTKRFLAISEVAVTAIFTVEYGLRVLAAKPKLKYVFSFYGLVDLLAILPSLLALGVNLQGIRAFRLFRLFRLLKLARYSAAMRRFGRAMAMIKEEAILFLSAALILLYLSAVGIYYFENAVQPQNFASIPHSMWWAVATLTSVGYGDIYPITAGGKVFTFVMLMLGLGVVAVPASLMSSALSKIRQEEKVESEAR
jgi:voltage-gated potassium channel